MVGVISHCAHPLLRVVASLLCYSNFGFVGSVRWVMVRSVISRALYDKRISQEVDGEALGDEFAGYVSAAAWKPSLCLFSTFLVFDTGAVPVVQICSFQAPSRTAHI